MLKHLVYLTFLLFPFIAQAQLVPAEGIKDAVEQATAKCSLGCLILSPEDITELQARIDAALQKAYEAGLKGWNTSS